MKVYDEYNPNRHAGKVNKRDSVSVRLFFISFFFLLYLQGYIDHSLLFVLSYDESKSEGGSYSANNNNKKEKELVQIYVISLRIIWVRGLYYSRRRIFPCIEL